MSIRTLLLFVPLAVGILLYKPAIELGDILRGHYSAPFEWHIVPKDGKPFDAKVHRQLDGSWEVSPAGGIPYRIAKLDDLEFMSITAKAGRPISDKGIYLSTLPLTLLVAVLGAVQWLLLRRAQRREQAAGNT